MHFWYINDILLGFQQVENKTCTPENFIIRTVLLSLLLLPVYWTQPKLSYSSIIPKKFAKTAPETKKIQEKQIMKQKRVWQREGI